MSDPLLLQPARWSDFGNTLSSHHPQFHSSGILTTFLSEGGLQNQKATWEPAWPGQKAKEGKKVGIESGPSPAGKHSDLKIWRQLTNPNHISHERVNDLSTTLKFHFNSPTGKEISWGYSFLIGTFIRCFFMENIQLAARLGPFLALTICWESQESGTRDKDNIQVGMWRRFVCVVAFSYGRKYG